MIKRIIAYTLFGIGILTITFLRNIVEQLYLTQCCFIFFGIPCFAFDRVSLTFEIDKQKETILYVDKTNPNNYYFDLSFLENQHN